MYDEINGQTSNQADREPISSGEELHVLSAESLDLVAGGPNGTIVVIG